MARDDDSSRSGCENLPQTPDSPTSAGFNSDQLPFNTIQNYTDDDDDEASVDPEIIRDEPDDVVNEEEDEGEDLFNDNFMELNCPEAAMRSLQLARQHASSEPERLVYEGWILYDTGHCEEGLRKAEESINLQRSFEAFFLKAYALADSSQDPSCSSTVVSLLEEALKCPSDRLRKGQALVQFSNSETASDAKDALDGRSIPRYLIPELGPCSLSIAYSAHTDLSVKFPSHRSRDYTNPLLTVAPSAIDASGQFSLGVDGKKLEPESNVLLASIENMQYSVTLDVLYTVFSSFGPVLKIAMFDKNGGLQALIQYPDVQTAVWCFMQLMLFRRPARAELFVQNHVY